jgi:hypothetical protein
MDRLLRDVQVGLVPGREPAPLLTIPEPPPASTVPAPDPPPASTVPAPDPPATAPPATDSLQLQALSELSARLLSSTRELLAGYERVLIPSARLHSPPTRRTPRQRTESPDVTLAAGPFASLEALREFERAVSQLPGVRDVAVRGYEGNDRAIIEVRLDQSNP